MTEEPLEKIRAGWRSYRNEWWGYNLEANIALQCSLMASLIKGNWKTLK